MAIFKRPNPFSPTSYPEVNLVLHMLLEGTKEQLGEQLVGLYIHGSLAAGDFTYHRSDIDFVTVTQESLKAENLPGLVQMHRKITGCGLEWATKLEGSYVPQDALRHYDPGNADYPALRVDGSFAIDLHGSDWMIQCHVLREHGIALAGPDIKTLIDPVTKDDLRSATVGILREWWAPVLNDQTRLQTAEYRAYAVLTMCRGMYTIEHGDIATKTKAAHWAMEGPGRPWASLIQHALAWRDGKEMDSVEETLVFIKFTLGKIVREA